MVNLGGCDHWFTMDLPYKSTNPPESIDRVLFRQSCVRIVNSNTGAFNEGKPWKLRKTGAHHPRIWGLHPTVTPSKSDKNRDELLIIKNHHQTQISKWIQLCHFPRYFHRSWGIKFLCEMQLRTMLGKGLMWRGEGLHENRVSLLGS